MFKINDEVFFVGGGEYFLGHVNDPANLKPSTYSQVAYKYNCTTNIWSPIAPVPDSLGHSQMFSFAISGIGYVGCGLIDSSSVTDKVWAYNPATDQWSSKTDFAGGIRRSPWSFAINGKGYVGSGVRRWDIPVDGIAGPSLHTHYAFDIWEFDPDGNAGAGSWTDKTATLNYIGFNGVDDTGNVCKSWVRGANFTTMSVIGERMPQPYVHNDLFAVWYGGMARDTNADLFAQKAVITYTPSTHTAQIRLVLGAGSLEGYWNHAPVILDDKYRMLNLTTGTGVTNFKTPSVPVDGDTLNWNAYSVDELLPTGYQIMNGCPSAWNHDGDAYIIDNGNFLKYVRVENSVFRNAVNLRRRNE
jgi:hypothetical protein